MGAPESLIRAEYRSLGELTLDLLFILEPPERLTVSQSASKYRYLNNQGSYVGPWMNNKVPYLIEPQDVLGSAEYSAAVFVGPAQCGKTDGLILNWAVHSIKTDPMDMIIYNPTQGAARDFSMRRVDRMQNASPEIKAMLSKERDADNRLDKHYRAGNMLTLSHPSVTEMAGKPIPRVALTDYDRFPEDIGGDGSAFDLAAKRTTTFGSFAMCLAESSPSRPIENVQWIATSKHQAPPATGIFALYNRGDRRRWYWPCPHCDAYFEGTFDHLHWDDTLPTLLDRAESVHMVCPVNGCVIRTSERFEMQQWGRWLKDGEYFDDHGHVRGEAARTNIASFWLRGVAAAFNSWPKLVATYLQATDEYETTRSEEALKKFYNTDLAEVYIPKMLESVRLPEVLKARAENLPQKMVPDDVRFLIATVDVQKYSFVVQVHGIAPGVPFDTVVIDRFSITKSKRLDADDDVMMVQPASYQEDWNLLIEQVMDKTYPLADGSGRRMMIKLTVCDSGGYSKTKEGTVTEQAYQFYRNLRADGKHGRFHLLKGDPLPNSPRTRITKPDAQGKARTIARGDVPVLMLNSNLLKDTVLNRLEAIGHGVGGIRFPNWLPDTWYTELCVEERTPAGWTNPRKERNEAWDLLYYCVGAAISSLISIERFNWEAPPGWAETWDKNDMILLPDEGEKFAPKPKAEYDFGKFGAALA